MVLEVKKLSANTEHLRDAGLILGLGRSPGGGNSNPLHYSSLENLMDRGAWRAMVHGVTKESVTTEGLSMHTSVYRTVYQ